MWASSVVAFELAIVNRHAIECIWGSLFVFRYSVDCDEVGPADAQLAREYVVSFSRRVSVGVFDDSAVRHRIT